MVYDCPAAVNLKILENFYQEIEINEKDPYQFLLKNLPPKKSHNQIAFERKLFSEEKLAIESDPVILRSKILKTLKLDEMIKHYQASPPKVEIVDEHISHDEISQRLKISDSLVGTFEAKITFPDTSLHKRPMILGIHGHGGNCNDFINQDMISKLFNKGFGILSISFRAMRRLHESIISRELVERGYHLMGVRLYEMFIAWQILKNHPLVNQERIGILAHSGGSVVANLFVRAFPNFRALVYDYESNFHRDWSKLCCESLPNLRPFRIYLQLARYCPIPAIKVGYGFRKDSNIVIDFFSNKLDDLVSNESTNKSKIQLDKSGKNIANCLNHYASIQDKCLLRQQIDSYFDDTLQYESTNYTKLRRPDSKIKYLLNELTLESPRDRTRLETSFDQILEIVKTIQNKEAKASLLNFSNESICKLGIKQCGLWMTTVRNDPEASIYNDLTRSVYVAALTSGSTAATNLITHLKGLESKTHTLLTLLDITGKPESIDFIKSKLKVLLEKESNPSLARCLSQLVDKAQFKGSCWEHSLVSDYFSKLGKLPNQLKSLVYFNDQKALTYLDLMYHEPEDLLKELLAKITIKPLDENDQTILAKQLDGLYRKRVRVGQAEGFIRELIPYLKSFGTKFRHQWISRALVLTQKESSSYEARASRLEVMEEALKVVSRSELSKIISEYPEFFDEMMLKRLISQALVIDNLDQTDLMLKKLSTVSPSISIDFDTKEVQTELILLKENIRNKFQYFLHQVATGGEYEDIVDWFDELSNRYQSVLNLIRPQLAEELFAKFSKNEFNDPALTAWWCIYSLFAELSDKRIDQWLKINLLKNLPSDETEDSQKIALAIRTMEAKEFEFFETILSFVKAPIYVREAEILRDLFLRNIRKTDLTQTILSIKSLNAFSRTRLTHLLFNSISRVEFIQNYDSLLELSQLPADPDSFQLAYDWVNCAIRLEFYEDASLQIRKIHVRNQRLKFRERFFLEELYDLWLDLDFPHKARELVLVSMQDKCSSVDCYHQITDLILNAIDNDKIFHEFILVQKFFKELNLWLSKNKILRENFCSDGGFEELCDNEGYFKSSELDLFSSR